MDGRKGGEGGAGWGGGNSGGSSPCGFLSAFSSTSRGKDMEFWFFILWHVWKNMAVTVSILLALNFYACSEIDTQIVSLLSWISVISELKSEKSHCKIRTSEIFLTAFSWLLSERARLGNSCHSEGWKFLCVSVLKSNINVPVEIQK